MSWRKRRSTDFSHRAYAIIRSSGRFPSHARQRYR
jgi:hypothetical protein